MASRIAAVIGATGAQGSGVTKALLKKGWTVRALTRKPDSDASKDLKSLGAQITVADINKDEDLKKAFSGANAVFSVTNFYETGEEGEITQGKRIIDAAKSQNVDHFIFSSLVNAKKITGGKNKVAHFTTKALVDDYLHSSGLPNTSVQIACYYENFQSFLLPRPGKDGVHEFTVAIPADTKFAIGSVADLGHVVATVIDNKNAYLNKVIPVAGDYLSTNEIAATFQKVWGVPVRANSVPVEVAAKFPFPHADEMADMFDFFNHFGYFGEKATKQDIWEGKKVYPGLLTFEQWVRQNLPTPPK